MVGQIDLLRFQDELEDHFLNPVSRKELAGTYEALISYGTELANLYVPYFQDDVCELERYSDDESANKCKDYLNAKLKGGIQSVFQYYATL